MPPTRPVSDLNQEIDALKAEGYRLDMIKPADDPEEALLSRNAENLRLVRSPAFRRPIVNTQVPLGSEEPPEGGTPYAGEWVEGRAGMQYRDLIPDRLDGRLIASHIRITGGGEVPDYVHYHKIDFQMIYCKAGWIRVVYEDQGPPFVIEPGDCVLQPPGIRHRVLEASAGAEVIELTSPAIHETWIEHELALPTTDLNPDRSFSGQRFVRHIANHEVWSPISDGFEMRDLGVREASSNVIDAKVVRTAGAGWFDLYPDGPVFLFVLTGSLNVSGRHDLRSDDSVLMKADTKIRIRTSPETQFLRIEMI